MAAVYQKMPQSAKSDNSSSAPAEIEMGSLMVADQAAAPPAPVILNGVAGGWSTGIFDCTLSPSSSFFACCVPFWIWSRSLTRARASRCFFGLIAAWLLLQIGAHFAFKGAGYELARSFDFIYNTTTYTDYAVTCGAMEWRECVADPFGPCAWLGEHNDNNDDARPMPGCRPRPTGFTIDRQKLHAGMGLGLLGVVFALVLVCLRACMRTRFRKRMGITGTALGDCVAHAVVPCCAIAQEARHADAAQLPRVDWLGRPVNESPVVMGQAISLA